MSKKVLIVEDELLIATVLKMQLIDVGYEVENVTTAEAALEKANIFKPDYIIMDIFLKNGGNGIETAKELRKRNISSKIIFTTGNSYESTLQNLQGFENFHILIKPVEFYHLHQIISK